LLVLILGLGLTVFSKEKVETEFMDTIRAAALGRALVTNFLFLLFSILFIYGSGFITVLVLNTLSMPVFYLIHFHYLKWRKKDDPF